MHRIGAFLRFLALIPPCELITHMFRVSKGTCHVNQKGKAEIVINQDGTGSHGTDPSEMKNKKVKDFMRKRGFSLSIVDFLRPHLGNYLC